jgi:phenylpropionate dioxygenase-like ring-hydroxylating dioxygenase large terminal subunit
MVRGVNTGKVHVFHNTCTHRGAVLCRQKVGDAKVFQCFYHAWTLDSEGELKGVPGREAYGEKLDFDALALKSVARVESYRGFVFARFDPGVQSLVDYLAGAREYLDLVVNDIMAVTVRTFMPTPPGRMEVTAWEMAPHGELPQLRQRRLDSFLTFLGPAGFATPDDVEALESCQQGFNSGGVEWNDISRAAR